MKDNYPMGAVIDPSAPYNMPPDPEPIKVNCSVCYCMSKSMPVNVENYTVSEDYGQSLYNEGLEYSFNDTNFIEEFKNDNDAMGIPTLLNELQRLSRDKIEQLHIELTMTNRFTPEGTREQIIQEIKYYKTVINATKNWTVDDLDVYKDE